jgi:hypothetical protein
MIKPELTVPDSNNALRQSGITGSGSGCGFLMMGMISVGYKLGVHFVVRIRFVCIPAKNTMKILLLRENYGTAANG